MNDSTAATAYAGQLAERVAELVPEMGTPERLDLLGVMDPDDLCTSLAFIASMYPQVFDFALVRDRAMTGRLVGRLGEDQADGDAAKCIRTAPDDSASEPGIVLDALLGAVLAQGHSARFARSEQDGAYLADLVGTTGSQASAFGRTPLEALQGAAAEYGIGDVYAAAYTAILDAAEDIATHLPVWTVRYHGRPDAGARQAANQAMDAIDTALGELYRLRERLVSDIRDSDDATAARADAMLAAGRRDQRGAALAIRMSRREGTPGAVGEGS